MSADTRADENAEDDARRAARWKQRHDRLRFRSFAVSQRELAATGRNEAASVRDLAAQIRADASRVRDDAARTRDDAARVRDGAARVRDQAAMARDRAARMREEATQKRVRAMATFDKVELEEVLELDRRISQQSREATTRDREAAELDRAAAEKDRQAAERDRTAALRDREAADKDRDAAEKDRDAADRDRDAAEADLSDSESDLDIAEERMSQSDRLASLGRLAAGVAHELNNPLASLLLTISSMESALQTEQTGPHALAPLLSDVRLSAGRIGDVVSEMRSWLYGTAENAPRTRVDLTKLVSDALRFCATEVTPIARVVIDIGDAPPLYGAAGRLSQVVTNLVVNAAHSFEGPSEANEIHLRAGGEGATVWIEVRDNGRGIAPDVLPHIFDPFFTTRQSQGGSGLGLTTCHRTISDHGGTLAVTSELGKGTTFRIELHAGSESDVAPASVAPAERAGSKRGRVLLIDDDEGFARSAVRALGSRHDITVAANGAEGLELLLAPGAAWDVVLCDLVMPVMNGIELYRRLAEVAPEKAAELVFISGGLPSSELQTFFAGLGNERLAKPFDIRELRALIDARLASRAASAAR